MSELDSWLENFRDASTDALLALLAYIPYLLSALALLAVGWVIARLVRVLIEKAAAGFDVILQNLGKKTANRSLRMTPGIIALIGNISFWIILLLFTTIATRVGRLDTINSWLDRIIAYVPTLLVGGLIALVGYVLSKYVREIIVTTAATTASRQGKLLGLIAQSVILLTSVVISLDQIGIDITFLTTLLGILIGASLLSLAIAFGFGARAFVGNLIGAQQVQQLIQQGETARIGDAEGQVLEITPTSVVLLTEQGRINVPAKLFQEQSALILSKDEDE